MIKWRGGLGLEIFSRGFEFYKSSWKSILNETKPRKYRMKSTYFQATFGEGLVGFSELFRGLGNLLRADVLGILSNTWDLMGKDLILWWFYLNKPSIEKTIELNCLW